MSVLNTALHEQLAIIMAALTKAAVAEICEVVDEGYAALQQEINRSHKENQDLRKKLHLIESIVVPGGGGGKTEGNTAGTQQQQPDRERGEAAAASGAAAGEERQELPEVVLIKDEDSDSDDIMEEGNRRSAGGDAVAAVREVVRSTPVSWPRQRRRSQGNGEDLEASSSECQVTAAPQRNISVFSLDSPRSEPGRSAPLLEEVQVEAGESSCSYSTQMEVHLVQDCSLVSPSSGGQVYYSGLTESTSNRAELDLNVDPVWTKSSKSPAGFPPFHQSEHVDRDAFGLKLVSVSGSGPLDCKASGSRSSFQYQDGAGVLTFGLYGDHPGQAQPVPAAQRKSYICSVCSKTYANAQNLEVHMRIHTGERPFTCDHCGKKFTQSSHLKSHLNVHRQDRSFLCSVCSKSFINKYSLKLHMKKSHLDPRPEGPGLRANGSRGSWTES